MFCFKSMFLKKSVFINVFKQHKNESNPKIVDHCLELIASLNISVPPNQVSSLKTSLMSLIKTFKAKFKPFKRSWKNFEAAKKNWIDSDFNFKFITTKPKSKKENKSVGRPRKSYHLQSLRSRNDRILKICLLAGYNTQLLIDGTLRSAKKNQDATLQAALKNLVDGRPHSTVTRMSSDEGLALFLKTGLSQTQFQIIRNGSLKHGANFLPTYKDIAAAKKRCYPENPIVSAQKASLSVQSLQNHTANRLVKVVIKKSLIT